VVSVLSGHRRVNDAGFCDETGQTRKFGGAGSLGATPAIINNR
jgi:hypothetical protein